SILNNNETNSDNDESKSTVKSTDHILLHIKNEPSISPSSWTNSKVDQTQHNDNQKPVKIPTPSSPPSTTFVPINITPTIQS
ncbi:unnamed protein product, partial [Rotaria socialis]